MIFLRYLLPIVLLKSTQAAEVESNHESNQVSNKIVTAKSKADDLVDVLWVEISKYLPFPQRELGLLNKAASFAVFQLYPYRALVASTLRIPELIRLNSDRDMAWFKNLILTKDTLKVIRAVSSGFFDQQAFPNSKGHIALYLIRSFFSLTPKDISPNEPNNAQLITIARALAELEDCSFFPIIASYPLAGYVVLFADFRRIINYIRSIFNVSKEEDPESFAQSVTTFNKILTNEKMSMVREKLLYCAVLAGIPEELYRDKLVSDSFTFFSLFKMPLARFHPDLSIEDSERIYSLFDTILDRIQANNHVNSQMNEETATITQETIPNHKIICKIAYKKNLPADFYENEIANGTFDHSWMQKFAVYALFTGKVELFKKLFADPRLGPKDAGQNLSGFANEVIYAVNTFEMEPERNFAIYLNNTKFVNSFVGIYDPMSIVFDENSVLTLKFVKQEKNATLPAPQFFEFAYDTRSNLVPASTFLFILLSSNETLDDNAFIDLVRSISDCPFFTEAIAENPPHLAKPSVIKRFGCSQELCELAQEIDLKFRVETKNIAELFRLENVCSTFIIDDNQNSPNSLLEMMVTPNQIRNYEIFTGRSIVDSFLDIVAQENRATDSLKLYNRFRVVALHILNGPHRQRLLDLQIPEFLQFLSEEVGQDLSSIN